jgi:hypothetical protein
MLPSALPIIPSLKPYYERKSRKNEEKKLGNSLLFNRIDQDCAALLSTYYLEPAIRTALIFQAAS